MNGWRLIGYKFLYETEYKELKKMVSKSAKYYQEHPLARKRKAMYDSKFESSPSQKKKRRELAKFNAAHDKKYGSASRKGMDASHTKSGIRYKPSSVNRGSKTDMAGDRRARGGR